MFLFIENILPSAIATLYTGTKNWRLC